MSQDDTSAAKVAENPRSADQITPCEPLRILHEPVNPLRSDAAHPYGRPSLHPGHEVERRPEAQRQSARAAALHELKGDLLLLRRSHGQEAEAKWARGFDELEALTHGHGVVDEAHRRIVMAKIG